MTTRLHRRFGPWIIHHAFEFKWHYFGAFACLYILQVLQIQIPEKIRTLTKEMSAGGLGDVSVWIFLGLALGILIFRTFSRLLFFYPARVQQKLLRIELLGKLEAAPPSRYKDWNHGQVYQVLFDDINNLRGFIGFGLLQICNLIITAWVLIPKLNETDAYLWPAFMPLFFSVVLFSVVSSINVKILKRMAGKKGEVQQFIIESYEAKQTIKNFHREETFIKGFVKLSAEELSLFFKSTLGFALTGPYTRLGFGISLLFGAVLVRRQGGDVSDLVFFVGFLYLFLEPVMFLSWVTVVLSQGFAAWKRVKALHVAIMTPSESELSLKDSSFIDSDEKMSVTFPFWDTSIEMNLKKGKWSVLIGETGSGKSVLLARLADTMRMKGISVSMVQQEPYLFNDTIAENIFLGLHPDEVKKEQAINLLKMFQLDNLGGTPEEIFAMEVGENGKRLSGGQMKRVALIRSLMSGAKVLVWDDPFSSVDIILERKIIRAIKTEPHWRDLTFIISSHRLTTVKLSDEVIYIDKLVGIKTEGTVERVLKEDHVSQFFKEQMVDIPLA